MKYDSFTPSLISVKDVMNKSLISVNLTTPAFQIAKMMQLGGMGAILVKENGRHVGIITDGDFATKITANKLPLDTPVKKIMSYPLITVNHNEQISSAVKIMHSQKVRKLAVVNRGKIVGLITSADLVNHMIKN